MFSFEAKKVLFVLGILGIYVLPILSRELFSPGFGVGIFFLLLLFVFLVLTVGALVAVVRHSKSKWVTWGAIATVALWVPVFWGGWLHLLGDHLYFVRREARLNILVDRLEQYRTIESMNDGQRHFKTVNGFLYRGAGENPPEAMPLATALDSAGVSVEAYQDVLQRLRDIGIVSFSAYDGRKAFVIDGFLDNYSGILYTPKGSQPEYGEYAPRGKIIGLTQVAPNWWLYTTT